jgi:NhaP-type Na+/H+ or K+/H+ antiporter
MLLYAVLSLTVIRILPVLLALVGTNLHARERFFVGWFGPRGLASIVFAVIVFDEGLAGKLTLAATVVCTVVLSILAHGVSASPLFRTGEK